MSKISLTRLLVEGVPATIHDTALTTQEPRQHWGDLDRIKEELADCLYMDPEEIQVGYINDKIQDPEALNDPFGNMIAVMQNFSPEFTGDVWAKFDVSKGTDRIASILNGMNFLENIEVNDCSGPDLSAIVSDKQNLPGNLIITSKTTESELIPFMRYVGMLNRGNGDGGFERYWSMIGGKVIGQESIERMQQRMIAANGIRQGRSLQNPNQDNLLGFMGQQ